MGKNDISSPQLKSEVLSNLHALSKDLYDKLFAWLVQRMNDRLMKIDERDLIVMEREEKVRSIGLLDIFGFEVL